MKLLSCTGTGQLYETVYQYQNQSCKTTVVQEAICLFFPITEIVLFATSESKKKNIPVILQSLAEKPVKVVDIPDGKKEKELWDIFLILAGEVDPGDEILIDITHGFRSIPFIQFLSAAYLRDVKGATIKGVYYGAFEARVDDITPVFDLTPFVTILDWMAAVRSFQVHCDASGIHEQIREINSSFHQPGAGEEGPGAKFTAFAKSLDLFTQALRLSRPREGVSVAHDITRMLPAVTGEISRFSPALVPVLEKINDIKRFSTDGDDSVNSLNRDQILKQKELILEQTEHGLFVQAVTLAREWMVSVLIFAVGKGSEWLDRDIRVEAERTLSGAVLQFRHNTCDSTKYLEWFLKQEYAREVTREWSRLCQLRNDLAHCGMNKEEQTSHHLSKQVRKVIPSALESGIRMLDLGFK